VSWHGDALTLAQRVTGSETSGELGFGPYTITVASVAWRRVHAALRAELGCTYFDWLSAADELAEGFRIACHVACLDAGVEHVLVTTVVPRESPVLESLLPVHAGAGWHERETHEMFGIDFTGGTALEGLLLPEGFEGNPLRKEFVLASRVAKPWPGAKEPGESDAGLHASPGRRRQRPAGVPEPPAWGPREPGSLAPDPLAHAAPAAARPRRGRPETPPPAVDADG